MSFWLALHRRWGQDWALSLRHQLTESRAQSRPASWLAQGRIDSLGKLDDSSQIYTESELNDPVNLAEHLLLHCSTKIKQKFLTMDSSRVFYADYHAISRFFSTGQSFEILSVKMAQNAILFYFLVPLDIKQHLN